MRVLIAFVLIPVMLFAAELPRTLGGLVPGENIETYVGILGYPSTQVQTSDTAIWNWGEGLMAKADKGGIIEEVIIIRAGRQKEFGFDIGDAVTKAVQELGKYATPPSDTKAGIYYWKDGKTKMVLQLDVDKDLKIQKMVLTLGS